MVTILKNPTKFLVIVLIITQSITGFDYKAMAQTTTEEGLTNNEEVTKLRGEIWYGIASWYGPKFHGKKTSNGERFSKYDLTAAHKTLPFNTKVLVTNLKNNKSVVVRINDRGPFMGDRIIDLSEAAAKVIEAKQDGLSYIKLQILNEI